MIAGHALTGPIRQPGPYYAIETDHVRIVAIDTGIDGNLDAEQGEWLKRVSADRKPKILVTGKPLLVNATLHPCWIGPAAARPDPRVGLGTRQRPGQRLRRHDRW